MDVVGSFITRLNRRYFLIFPAVSLLLCFLWPLPVFGTYSPPWEPPAHERVTWTTPYLWALIVCAALVAADYIWLRLGRYGTVKLKTPALVSIYAVSAVAAVFCSTGLAPGWSMLIRAAFSILALALFYQSSSPYPRYAAGDGGSNPPKRRATTDEELWKKRNGRARLYKKLFAALCVARIIFLQADGFASSDGFYSLLILVGSLAVQNYNWTLIVEK